MSKIFLMSDTHIGLGFPNKTEKWFKIHQEYFSKFFIPLLKEKARPGDIVVHLGDLFDNRNVIPIDLLNYGMDIVEEISKICPLHIIVGNHDLWSKSASEINAIRPFRWIPNVFIYDKSARLEFNGIKICMMPYIEKKTQQINLINEFKDCDYLFCHSDLNGCKMHLTSVAHRNTDKIDIEDFKHFRKVRSGHIHLVQSNKHFSFVGSPFHMDRNDMNDRKGIFIINTEDDSEEFIPNEISPEFKKVYLLKEDDIDKLDQLPEKDFIDLIISNSLLIGNRKIRRKLEVMLEKGIFSSVDYIDDITEKKELTDEEKQKIEKVLESIDSGDGSKLQINLEYKELIRDYINNLKYDSEKNKLGIMSEYEEIIKIYEENYTIGE